MDKRSPSEIDPRGYVISDLPEGMDPEAGSATLRLLAQRRETTPERLAKMTDDEIRVAFVAEGLTDRDIAREVVIGRNIRDIYDLNDLPKGRSMGELIDAGEVDEDDWKACFTVLPGDIDEYLRDAYGEAYGK